MSEQVTQTITMVDVYNRNNGRVGYTIPEDGIVRAFNPNEHKKIPLTELQKLQYQDGGAYMLENYLMINDESALATLNMNPEPDYFYTEAEVKELLTTGTLAQLEDTLTFAPAGVIDMVKKLAYDMQIPDINKRTLIAQKTGFNIDNAIRIEQQLNAGEEEAPVKVEKPQRAAAPISTRRKAEPVVTKIPSYNIVK